MNGTTGLADPTGVATDFFTDSVIAGYSGMAGVPNSGNVNNTLNTPKAVDTIWFTKSGDYTNIAFTQIEAIRLKDGVSITLSSDQLEAENDSLAYGPNSAFNPGLHFYGVAGGKTETVNFEIEYADTTAGGLNYSAGDLQFDDYDIGDVFHNVKVKVDAKTGSTLKSETSSGSYMRSDGSNNDDYVTGSNGVDNFDGRLGNDTYFGGTGNDKLTGQGGGDTLDGGAGDDFFLVTSFAGTDGRPEWEDGDMVTGGKGMDTFRITGANGAAAISDGESPLIELTDSNFKTMERVEVGGTVTRLTTETSATQLINDHYYHNAGGTLTGGDAITVDASAIKKNGLTFVGNANANTFIGTQKDDTFIGNGGNDILTGGKGKDVFVFGQVHTMTKNDATIVYDDISSVLSGSDSITDFTTGKDKIHLNNDFFAAFTTTGAINAGNLVMGTAAAEADDFLLFDGTSGALSYDADGNGVGAAIQIATLTGVASLAVADFSII